MKKIQNLFLVALLAACSMVSVSAMWEKQEIADEKLQAFNYEALEEIVRSGLSNEDYKFDVTKWLCNNAERSLDPFMLFHAARARLTTKVLGGDQDIIQGLSFLFLSLYRTMQSVKVCELAYKHGTSYAQKYKALVYRLSNMFLPYKEKAESLGLNIVVQHALSLVKAVNVRKYGSSFWVMSVGSNVNMFTRRGPSFYFFNPQGTLLREIEAFKINSRLIGDALKYRIASGIVILQKLSACEIWEDIFKINIEKLGSLKSYLENDTYSGIDSFGLSSEGIFSHTEEEEYSDEDGDELTGENDLNYHEDTDSIEVAVPTPIEENSRVVPVLDAVNLGELDGEEERAIEEALDMLRDEASTNPPAQTQQPVEEEMLALEDTGKLPAPVQAAPAPSSSEPAQQEVVPMEVEEQNVVSTPVATGNEEAASSEDQFVINAVVEADVVEELTAELAQLGVQDAPKGAPTEVKTPKIKPPVPARVRTTKSGGTVLGGPPNPARKVGGARTPEINRKKKGKKKST